MFLIKNSMAHIQLFSDDVLLYDSLGLNQSDIKKNEINLFTPHFNYDEFFIGCTSYERKTINPNYVNNIFRLSQMLTIIRQHFGKPINITSCYRDNAHNKRVGGVSTSQHLTASAVDFNTSVDLFFVIDYIRKNLSFGQLIWYKSLNFIHISLPDSTHSNEYLIKD